MEFVEALSVCFSDSRCYVLSSSKYFLKKNRLEMLLYKYNFNIAIMQHNLLATDRIKLTTIREILGLMASRQVEKAPSDGISPAEEKLEFDDATLRGK